MIAHTRTAAYGRAAWLYQRHAHKAAHAPQGAARGGPGPAVGGVGVSTRPARQRKAVA